MKDYRATLNAVGWVLTGLSTIFISARLYARLGLGSSRVGWDDWCMLAAYVSIPEYLMS